MLMFLVLLVLNFRYHLGTSLIKLDLVKEKKDVKQGIMYGSFQLIRPI